MKKLFYIAAVALLTLGMVSCHKDDDNTNNNTNNNTPTNPSNPTNPTDTTQIARQATQGAWVDLGLSVQWYSVNLGATTPEGYGDYYAWGEVWPRNVYSWANYTYGDYDSETSTYTMYKYNTLESYGTVDNKTTLEASDDVATAVLGSGARIPTKAEWQELLDNTTAEWTTVNNVNGCKFTAANGSSLFLPAAGYRGGSSLYSGGTHGYYWSSSLNESYPGGAWNMFFSSDGQYVGSSRRNRGYGQSVRAVRSQN